MSQPCTSDVKYSESKQTAGLIPEYRFAIKQALAIKMISEGMMYTVYYFTIKLIYHFFVYRY
jgi:hypothetical protein